MDDTKNPQTHPDLGDVGDLGAAGDLGANAADAKRPAITLEPAQVGDPQAPLVKALMDTGFTADEAERLAASAIEEIARRKG